MDLSLNNIKKKSVSFPFLKKGGGSLASDFHINTKFAKQRKKKTIREQEEREKKINNN